MNVEQRLVDALRSAEHIEPSPDLWMRVVHSIEEDRLHRRRVLSSVLATAATLVGLGVVGVIGLTDGIGGRQVRVAVMELIETVALVVLVVVLGPAIRRFGRGYAADLWPAAKGLAAALLRLLDVAYLLVFSGYILLSAELDVARSDVLVADQIRHAAERIGGLLLVMGLLHALTIMVLPVVALISNSTRVGRKLPRWLVVALIPVGIGVAMMATMGLVGLVAGSS
jgi:hypothetical protein